MLGSFGVARVTALKARVSQGGSHPKGALGKCKCRVCSLKNVCRLLVGKRMVRMHGDAGILETDRMNRLLTWASELTIEGAVYFRLNVRFVPG